MRLELVGEKRNDGDSWMQLKTRLGGEWVIYHINGFPDASPTIRKRTETGEEKEGRICTVSHTQAHIGSTVTGIMG